MRHLVIQLARFGDLVQTKRLLCSLLAEGAEVHLCLDESLAGLAALLYPLVRLHPLCAHGTAVAKLPAREGAALLLAKNIPVFREIAATAFDKIYNLNFSPLNYRMASLFDPGRVRGHVWRNGQESVGQWARLAMRWSALRRIGINIEDFWAWHHAAPIAPETVNPPAQGRGGGIGVVMAGRESRRSLPTRVLAPLVAGLMDIHQASAVLLGGPAEAKAARQLLHELPSRLSPRVRDLCGGTDLPGLASVVQGLDLLLTPDTGTMHLAAGLGVPVLATFLSSAWCFETGPYGQGHRVLQAVTDCLPCLESSPCGENLRCLRPFEDAGLVRYLATGNARHLPEGLIALESRFDAIGQTYACAAGEDGQAQPRRELRQLLARHLGQGGDWRDAVPSALAERLYAEADWQVADAESSAGRLLLRYFTSDEIAGY
jgi:ADP-heptose:LPS heptosyltransferase